MSEPTLAQRLAWLYSHANREIRNEYDAWIDSCFPDEPIPLSEAIAGVITALDVTGLPLAKSCHDTDGDGDCPLCVVISGPRRGERFMRCPKVWPS